jgi:hypothetical protein
MAWRPAVNPLQDVPSRAILCRCDTGRPGKCRIRRSACSRVGRVHTVSRSALNQASNRSRPTAYNLLYSRHYEHGVRLVSRAREVRGREGQCQEVGSRGVVHDLSEVRGHVLPRVTAPCRPGHPNSPPAIDACHWPRVGRGATVARVATRGSGWIRSGRGTAPPHSRSASAVVLWAATSSDSRGPTLVARRRAHSVARGPARPLGLTEPVSLINALSSFPWRRPWCGPQRSISRTQR